MMVNSAKDMFSDTETLKDVHFDTMSYLYFENQGRNAVYIDAVDDNDRYTKLMISPGDKSKIDLSRKLYVLYNDRYRQRHQYTQHFFLGFQSISTT